MEKTVPKHRRVYAALRHDILIGKYDKDERFPSEGMLMRRFGVSRITVRQAMADLKNEGFLEARSGSGTYLSALARHATGMIGLVIPDYSSSQFFRRLGDELVRAGKVRSVRVGKKILISRKSLMDWLEKGDSYAEAC